jgi:multicomponent Na+:H+ antiporter subunit B
MKHPHQPPFESLMLRHLMGPLLASLQIFLLYVIVHGHYSPGGAFQGGTLLASVFLLPLLAGHTEGFLRLSPRGAVAMSAIGVAIFSGVGVVAMLFGGSFLDYNFLPFGAMELPARQSLGILLIEVGVTFAVAGALVSIYYSLKRDPHPGSHSDDHGERA